MFFVKYPRELYFDDTHLFPSNNFLGPEGKGVDTNAWVTSFLQLYMHGQEFFLREKGNSLQANVPLKEFSFMFLGYCMITPDTEMK